MQILRDLKMIKMFLKGKRADVKLLLKCEDTEDDSEGENE